MHYQCTECGRQFVESYSTKGYSTEIKKHCLTLYVNGNGFRAIERTTGVNHNTVIRWVRKTASTIPNAPEVSEIPEIAEIDELQTFVAKKKQIVAKDGCKPLETWNFSLGNRRSLKRNF